MNLSEACIKQVGELQFITLKLFSTFEGTKNMYLDSIRFKLKNEEKMNYGNVLKIKKLLEERLAGQKPIENF